MVSSTLETDVAVLEHQARQTGLDETDLAIVEILREDGRATNRVIAARLRLPESTARDRLRRLSDTGLMRVAPVVDYRAAGHSLLVHYLIEVRGHTVTQVARQLATIDDLDSVAVVSGKHDILAQSFRPGLEFMVATLRKIAEVPGVADVECRVALELPVCKTETSPIRANIALLQSSMPTIDPQDLRIIELLCDDGRMAQSEIAKRLGMSHLVVRRRLGDLQDRKVLRFAPRVDPPLVGNQVNVFISIDVELASVEYVLRQLEKFGDISFLAAMVGARYVVVCAVSVPSHQQLLDALARFAEIDGVIRTETAYIIRMYKTFAVLGIVQ